MIFLLLSFEEHAVITAERSESRDIVWETITIDQSKAFTSFSISMEKLLLTLDEGEMK